METDKLPVINFSACGLNQEKPDEEKLASLGKEVHQALSTFGFMYLKNSGISSELIGDTFRVSKQFFDLPQEEKMQYERCDEDLSGYTGNEKEWANLAIPYKDLKEVFNFVPTHTDQKFPDAILPEFHHGLQEFFDVATHLHNRVLQIIAVGLQIEDPLYLVKHHKLIGGPGNTTTLRTTFYQPLEGVAPKEGQIRCGEHTDIGGVSLIFQDSQSGLEVKNMYGEWVSARPIDGTIVVILGDLMQRWTADVYKAALHRVSLPTDEASLKEARRSLIYFGTPDEDVIIECLDNSNKYPPIRARDNFDSRVAASVNAPIE